MIVLIATIERSYKMNISTTDVSLSVNIVNYSEHTRWAKFKLILCVAVVSQLL